MKNLYSPFNISILIQCRINGWPVEHANSEAGKDAIKSLLEAGAIRSTGFEGCYETTPLGNAWVQALCNVPPPRAVFVDEQGNVLEGCNPTKA